MKGIVPIDLACWRHRRASEAPASQCASASCYRFPEDISVLAVVVAELEFSEVQGQVVLADVVIGADDSALEQRPEGIEVLGMHFTAHVFTLHVGGLYMGPRPPSFAGVLDLLTERGGGDYIVRVKSYANVLTEYETHPESKSAGSVDVNPRQARGLLERRHVHIVPENIYYIGKESNRLEVPIRSFAEYPPGTVAGSSLVYGYARRGPGVPFRCAASPSADEKRCLGMLRSANRRRSEGPRSLTASTTISTVSSPEYTSMRISASSKSTSRLRPLPPRMMAWGM